MLAVRGLFRAIHLNGRLPQQLVKSSSFKVPFTLDRSSESEDAFGDSEDRYVKKWLTQKVFHEQSIEDFKPYLKKEEDVKKMEWILQEFEVVKYDSSLCPSHLPMDRVEELLAINSQEKLYSYFVFLYKRENRKNALKLRRSENRSEMAIALRKAHIENIPLQMGIRYDPETGKPIYGKWRNSCFLDLGRKDTYTSLIPANVAASQFGQKLVIDFSYDNCMLPPENKSLIKQLCFSHQAIREAEEPFDTWFCNLDEKGRSYGFLDKVFGWNHKALFTSHFINHTPKSYLDLFPPEKCVYLCPDSNHDFTTFDHDSIYIVGALVDRTVVKPVSLAKCKKEKIKHVRLPLDQHLSMIGSKVLTVDQVISILIQLKHGRSMEEALKTTVPERKIKSPEQVQFEKERRLLRLTMQRNSRKTNLYHNEFKPSKHF